MKPGNNTYRQCSVVFARCLGSLELTSVTTDSIIGFLNGRRVWPGMGCFNYRRETGMGDGDGGERTSREICERHISSPRVNFHFNESIISIGEVLHGILHSLTGIQATGIQKSAWRVEQTNR